MHKCRLPVVLFFGLPHSGKSTLVSHLATAKKFSAIDFGSHLRALIASKSSVPYLEEVKNAVQAGRLVPDDVSRSIISDYVRDEFHFGLAIDGFPRKLSTLAHFYEFLTEQEIDNDCVLACECHISSADSRTHSVLRGRKDDVDLQILDARISVFQKETSPTILALRQKHHYLRLDFKNGLQNNILSLETTLNDLFHTKDTFSNK